ncbi:MAG: DUF3375 family protein [Treponema sp.]
MRSSHSTYIAALITGDSGLRLLRSKNPEITISFLYSIFREKHIQTIEAVLFETLLADFLHTQEQTGGQQWFETQTAEEPELSAGTAGMVQPQLLKASQQALSQAQIQAVQTMESKAHILTSKWCSESVGYIRRYYNDRHDVIIELSAGVERLFTWLDTMDSGTFIAAESRFQDILHRLRELSENTVQDAQTQIAELKKKKQEIQERINTIARTGKAETYTPVQMVERLHEVARASRELLSDFRIVEDNFKVILADVYKKQSGDETKGAVLGYALDAHLEMKETPQGQTFDTFWAFLAADAGKNEINELTRTILAQVQQHGIAWEDTFLLHLKQYLHEAGRKIIDSTHSLTHRLNRMLLSQNYSGHHQLTELIRTIKGRAFELAGSNYSFDRPLTIQTKAVLSFPYARTPVLPTAVKAFAPLSAAEQDCPSLLHASGIFNQFFVDESRLKKNIARYRTEFLTGTPQFSLGDLTKQFPIEQGLSEVAAYFALRSKLRPAALVLEEVTETITYRHNGSMVVLTLPKLIFS